jgi:hypothetical protein
LGRPVVGVQSFAGEAWQEAVIASDEQHLLKSNWIEHDDVIPVPSSET